MFNSHPFSDCLDDGFGYLIHKSGSRFMTPKPLQEMHINFLEEVHLARITKRTY